MTEQNKENIRYIALQLGFSECRFSKADCAPHGSRYQEWLDSGMNGDMEWLERNIERRKDPREILAEAKTVISLAINYNPGVNHPNREYRIAKYSWNNDYHDLIESKLKDLDSALSDLNGTQRYYVDTGPILERDFATESGLGWNGKSTVQIHPKLGTWFFLAEIITDLEITPDKPIKNRCGSCTRCMTSCPTQAIYAPNKMDARKCISYLTIEHKGAIPLEYRKAIGNRIYGCDECLEVCPWNRFAAVSQEISFHARHSIFQHSLSDFLELDEEQFRGLFAKSPIKRIKRARFLRNVCVALGNVGTMTDLPALQRAVLDSDSLISEHANWAITEITTRNRVT